MSAETEAALSPDWRDMDDNGLRDLIEANERSLEMMRNAKRRRGRAAVIRRLTTRVSVLQAEEDRRIHDAHQST